MDFKDILSGAKTVFWKGVKTVKHDFPMLELIFGSACVVGSAVALIQNAREIAEVNDQVEDMKYEIKVADNDPKGWSEMGETRKQYISRNRREIAVGYLKAAGPALIPMAVGITANFKAGVDFTTQIEAGAANALIYASILSKYRNRVIEKEGTDADYEYLTGQAVTRDIVVNDDGSSTETVKVERVTDGILLPHGFVFDERNPNWTNSPAANLNFIAGGLRSANWMLERQEWITDNDIFSKFDGPKTVAGQSAGAFRDWKDGTVHHKLRIRPEGVQNLVNGTDPHATLIFEYDDGTPLEADIWSDPERLGVEVVNTL